MASPKQVQVVVDLHQTFTERDVPEFVTHLTDDVILRPSTLIAGREEYRGIEDVKKGFGELRDLLDSRGEDVTVEPLRFYVDRGDDDLVVSLTRVTVTREDEKPSAAVPEPYGEKSVEVMLHFMTEVRLHEEGGGVTLYKRRPA